jgi:hypothetical protein
MSGCARYPTSSATTFAFSPSNSAYCSTGAACFATLLLRFLSSARFCLCRCSLAPFYPTMASLVTNDSMQEKHSQPETAGDSAGQPDWVIATLRNGVITEALAVHVHRLLKVNPAVRTKWLEGMPLQQALQESPSPPWSRGSMRCCSPRSATPLKI